MTRSPRRRDSPALALGLGTFAFLTGLVGVLAARWIAHGLLPEDLDDPVQAFVLLSAIAAVLGAALVGDALYRIVRV